jgi:peptidoglycan/LPS O-acetylase OafA/YrhL
MPVQPERIIWIDTARGLAILSIIALHAGIFPSGIILAAFQLPLFAFLSGYVTNWSNLSRYKLALRWMKWTGTYILSGAFALILWQMIARGYGKLPLALTYSFSSQWEGFTSGVGLPANGPLWFLLPFALAVTAVSFFYVLRPLQRLIFVLLLLPWSDMATKVLFASLVLGAVWGEKALQPKLTPLQFVLTSMLFVTSALMNGSTELHYGVLNNLFLFIVSSFTGVMLTLHIASVLPSTLAKLLGWIGRRSLSLFVLHWPVMIFVTFVLWKIGILGLFDATPGLTAPMFELRKTIPRVTTGVILWSLTFGITTVLTLAIGEALIQTYEWLSGKIKITV